MKAHSYVPSFAKVRISSWEWKVDQVCLLFRETIPTMSLLIFHDSASTIDPDLDKFSVKYFAQCELRNERNIFEALSNLDKYDSDLF